MKLHCNSAQGNETGKNCSENYPVQADKPDKNQTENDVCDTHHDTVLQGCFCIPVCIKIAIDQVTDNIKLLTEEIDDCAQI